jgi:uncharacterized membrane protein
MLLSILIGLVAGQRGMTPLAVVAGAARRGDLPADAPLKSVIGHPLIAAGAVAMAAAEYAGDKMPTAPNRTVAIGLATRAATAAYAGAALAPDRRKTAAALAVAAAIASSYAGLALRLRAMRRFSQTTTGFVEDALVLGAGLAVTRLPAR